MFAAGNPLQLINEKIFHLQLCVGVAAAIAPGGFLEECIAYTPAAGVPLRRKTALGPWTQRLCSRHGGTEEGCGPVADMGIVDEAAVQQNIEKLDIFNRADLYFPAA